MRESRILAPSVVCKCSLLLGVSAATGDGSACNTLTVPGFLGAIPRPPRRRYQHASSTESDSAANTEQLSTPLGSTAATGAAGTSAGGEERRCFCGYYSEVSTMLGKTRDSRNLSPGFLTSRICAIDFGLGKWESYSDFYFYPLESSLSLTSDIGGDSV